MHKQQLTKQCTVKGVANSVRREWGNIRKVSIIFSLSDDLRAHMQYDWAKSSLGKHNCPKLTVQTCFFGKSIRFPAVLFTACLARCRSLLARLALIHVRAPRLLPPTLVHSSRHGLGAPPDSTPPFHPPSCTLLPPPHRIDGRFRRPLSTDGGAGVRRPHHGCVWDPLLQRLPIYWVSRRLW